MIRELSSETGCLRCPVEDRALGCLASVFFASSVSSLWCEVMCQRGFQVLDESHRCLKTPLRMFCRGGLNIAWVYSAVRCSRQLLVIALHCVGGGGGGGG